jgi:hypothetical protein
MANDAISQAQLAQAQAGLNLVANKTLQLFAQVDAAKKTALISVGTDQLKADLDKTRQKAQAALEAAKNAVYTGTYKGKPLTKATYRQAVRDMVNAVNAYGAVVKEWNDKFFASKVIEGTLDTLAKLLKAAKSAVDTASGLIQWLPWIAGVLILGPPLIRIGLAGKSGGTRAALRETGSALERGRSAVAAGARRASRAIRPI